MSGMKFLVKHNMAYLKNRGTLNHARDAGHMR